MDIIKDLDVWLDAASHNEDPAFPARFMELVHVLETSKQEITHLREQLAASQAECIALQNRMDEQVTAWRAECLDLQNKLAEATEKAE